MCERYKSLVKKKLRFGERHFTQLTVAGVRDLVRRVNVRLGYTNTTLSYRAVDLMWDMCRFELSFFYNSNRSSSALYPWCAVFSDQDMKLLEENEDLYYYYKDGYPYNITLNMTSVLLHDLIKTVKNRGSNKFYFAHSETLIPLLARLGVARDDPPLSLDNMPDDRLWRTSLIGGESANIVVLGYNCDNQTKLSFFLNERLVGIEGCESGHLCDASDFVENFEKYSLESLGDMCDE